MLVYVNIVFVYEEEAKSLNIKSFSLQYEHNLMINESYTSQIMMHVIWQGWQLVSLGKSQLDLQMYTNLLYIFIRLLAGERFTVSITGEVSYT